MILIADSRTVGRRPQKGFQFKISSAFGFQSTAFHLLSINFTHSFSFFTQYVFFNYVAVVREMEIDSDFDVDMCRS